MKTVRRIARIAGYALLLIVALAAGAAAVLTMTEGGRTRLAGLISSTASSPEQQIRISGLDGILSGNLTIRQVVISDGNGPWLVARNGAVDWSPTALLGGRFDASRVHFDRIEIARLPASSTTAETSDEPFSLPLDIDIDALSLPDVALGTAIAGDIASLAAEGKVAAEGSPLTIQGDLRVARTDGRDGSMSAIVAFVPADNRLDIQVEGSEPADGVLANLLRIEGTPAVDIAFSGEGPASDWSGMGTMSLNGTVVTRISARHRLTEEGNRVTAEGEGNFEAFLPLGLRPLVAGDTTFDIDGLLDEDGGIVVKSATLQSAAIAATAAGETDPNGATDINLEAKARSGPVPLKLDLGDDAMSIAFERLALRAFGAGTEPMVDGVVEAARIGSSFAVIEGASAKVHSDGFDLAGLAGPVTLDVSAAAIGTENETLARVLAGGVDARFELDLDVDNATIRQGNVKTGTLDAKLSGTAARDGSTLKVAIDADMARGVLPEAAHVALADRVGLKGTITRSAETGIGVENLVLTSGDLSATANATVGPQEIDAEITGGFTDLTKLEPGSAGQVTFTVKASGETFRPDLTLTVTSDRIETGGRTIEGLELSASGRADLDNPAADVTLSGTISGQELKGAATLRSVDGRREIDNLLVSLGKNRIEGDLLLDDAFVPIGSVSLDLPDIGALAALALEEIEGSATGTVEFTKEGGAPLVRVEATVPSFKRGEIGGSDIRVAANVSNYMQAPLVAGQIGARVINSGGTRIDGLSVTLDRDGAWTGFDGKLQVNAIPVSAAGRARIADGNVTVELKEAGATLQGMRAALARPTTVTVRDGVTRLEALVVSVAGGNAEINGTVADALNLNIRVGALPAAAVNNFAAGLGAEGTISGTIAVTGPASAPKVDYAIDWRGGSTVQTREAGFGAMTVTSNGTYSGERVRFTAKVGDGTGLGLNGGGTVDIGGAGALNLNFDGSVPFSFLTGRLAAQGLALDGTSRVSLGVSGPLRNPQVTASITTGGARLIAARQGIAINDLAAEIGLSGGVATIKRLTGKLSTGGTLNASGTVVIDASRGFPADLTIRMSDGRYTDGQVVTANFAGDLKVTGALTGTPLLSGTVNLGRTVITVPERLPASLATLDVQHKNAPAAVRQQTQAIQPEGGGGGGGGGLSLDVNVNAPQQIFIQGRGLDAELGGALRLTGPASAPQAVGRFTMRRGRLSILGRRLDFTRGNIGFSGSLVPYLDLAADSTVNDATVTVLVTGPATNPAFRFSSSPSLPEDEVLARLVFGRSLSSLSPVQIAQLAAAAAQLAGVGGSTSLLDTLRDKAGVDDIDIKTDDEGNASVAVGKYLNDRTYVTIEKGGTDGSGKATINLDIGRGLKLRGEASDGGEAKGGIYFERDY